jgi:hypothetical protein
MIIHLLLGAFCFLSINLIADISWTLARIQGSPIKGLLFFCGCHVIEVEGREFVVPISVNQRILMASEGKLLAKFMARQNITTVAEAVVFNAIPNCGAMASLESEFFLPSRPFEAEDHAVDTTPSIKVCPILKTLMPRSLL